VPPCGVTTLLADDERIVEEPLQDLSLLHAEGESRLGDAVLSIVGISSDGPRVRPSALSGGITVNGVRESLGLLSLAENVAHIFFSLHDMNWAIARCVIA